MTEPEGINQQPQQEVNSDPLDFMGVSAESVQVQTHREHS